MKITVETLRGWKGCRPFGALTAYDYPGARLLDEAGVPVLASNIGSLGEMISHGHQGWLVKPADPIAWAEALRTALSAYPDFKPEPVKIKTMDENATEMLSIYAETWK